MIELSNIAMQQWLISTLSILLPSLIVAICTAIITVRFSLRQFRAEQLWERRAEAYSRIVEALYNAMEYCSAMSEESMSVTDIGEDKKKQLVENYQQAVQKIKKAAGIGAYIISDDVADALARLEARPRPDWDKYAPFEIFDEHYDAYKKTLAEIRNLAKRDLKT